MYNCIFLQFIDSVSEGMSFINNEDSCQLIDVFINEISKIVSLEKRLECFIEYENIVNDFIRLFKSKNKENFSDVIVDHIFLLEAAKKLIVIKKEEIKESNIFNDILKLEVEKEERYNSWHNRKRCYSFEFFDSFLSLCEIGVCPKITEKHHYYLVDISLEKYIELRAYYYYCSGIGIDDTDRYFMANRKVENVFNCSCESKVDHRLFDIDMKHTVDFYKNSVRNRKAYWEYLSNINRDANINYCEACSFLEKQYLYDKSLDLQEYKKIIINNKNKANAFDLFRICDIRRRFFIYKNQRQNHLPSLQ